MPGSAVTLAPLVRRRLARRSRLAALACLLLAAPDPRADASISRSRLRHGLGQPDAPRGRRQRRLGDRHRRAPATAPCSAGLAQPPDRWPRTRSCSRWRRVLDRFGPTGHPEDEALRAPRAARSSGHTLRGSLVVVGAGDPALGQRGLRAPQRPPADPARQAGRRHPQGRASSGSPARIRADDSIFDRRRGIPTTGVDASGELGPLSGLSYNSGFVHGHYAKNPELRRSAGAEAQAAKRSGSASKGGTGRADLPARALAQARRSASVSSPPMASLIAATLRPSNNFFAEMLLKRLAASRAGAKGTTRRGARKVEEVRPQARHGRQDGERLGALALQPRLAAPGRPAPGGDEPPARTARPTAARSRWPGEQGTVADRMNGTAADGRCRTKTGTLIGVSALSGYCNAGPRHWSPSRS